MKARHKPSRQQNIGRPRKRWVLVLCSYNSDNRNKTKGYQLTRLQQQRTLWTPRSSAGMAYRQNHHSGNSVHLTRSSLRRRAAQSKIQTDENSTINLSVGNKLTETSRYLTALRCLFCARAITPPPQNTRQIDHKKSFITIL